MTTLEKVNELLNNIESANLNTARTDLLHNSIHNFEIKVTSYNVASLVKVISINSTEELNEIITQLVEKLKHLSFTYNVQDCRLRDVEKGYIWIHYPTL